MKTALKALLMSCINEPYIAKRTNSEVNMKMIIQRDRKKEKEINLSLSNYIFNNILSFLLHSE